MKHLIFILILCLFTSCALTRKLDKEKLCGLYGQSSIYGVGSSMELRVDGTFRYIWRQGLNSGVTLGTWDAQGRTIILESNRKESLEKSAEIRAVQSSSKKCDSLYIKVMDFTDELLPFVSCALKKDTSIFSGGCTDWEGELCLPKLNADSLIISYVGYYQVRHSIRVLDSVLEFKLRTPIPYFRYFNNEAWEYKRKRLYAQDSEMTICYNRIK